MSERPIRSMNELANAICNAKCGPGKWVGGHQDEAQAIWSAVQAWPGEPEAQAAAPLREALEKADRWVLSHAEGQHDWACRRCHPEDDGVSPDWLCAIHEAKARAALEGKR